MITSPVDVSAPVHEIVEILHKHKIPLASVDTVFKNVMDDIQANTIPYSPSFDKVNAFATSSSTENDMHLMG